MPPTQTTCPPAGTARAAVVRPLARGSDPVIVYQKGSFGQTFVRYDVVTHQKTTILSLNVEGQVSQAQLSSDGQWLLFVAPEGTNQNPYNEIQMVRLDGQGLQTLYCSPATTSFSIMGMQWSLDDKTVIFSQGSSVNPALSTLLIMDSATGSVQQELVKLASMPGFFAATWLDQTHVYLTQSDSNGEPQALFLLDTARGPQQSVNQLTPILGPVPTGTDWSFDTSIDGSRIYTTHCQHPDIGTYAGPGTISVLPATGGQPTTIHTDQTHAIVEVRIMTRSLLAYVVDNQNSGDTAENGLWMMNLDGTGSKRLSSSLTTVLNSDSQYTWANFSRDGSMYAVFTYDGQQSALIFGSLTENGSPTTLESEASRGEDYGMVGWTTL